MNMYFYALLQNIILLSGVTAIVSFAPGLYKLLAIAPVLMLSSIKNRY